MKNVLVVGGAGYIGSHTCKALYQAGYQPIVYDNLSSGHRWAVKWGPLEVGDISDTARLKEVMLNYLPVAVMHFAAFAYVGESVLKPLKYYKNNVAGTINLIEVMKSVGVDKIVFSSTCATYGTPAVVPITEDNKQVPINPYGKSKLMVEEILKDVASAYGIQSVSLRYFNAAGADPDATIGEVHEPETHLIPLILEAAAGKRKYIEIFGDDYSTTDGTCIRDYIHVMDLASAHILTLKKLEVSPITTSYNLGNGKGFSVKEVIKAVEHVTGKNIPVVISKRRPGDPPILVGDASLIREELGWVPNYPLIESQIEHAWNWYVKYFNSKV